MTRGQPSCPRGPVGDADLREMLDGARRSTNLLDPERRRGAAPRPSSCCSARERARADAGLRRGRPAARRAPRRSAGRSATAPTGPELLPLRSSDRLRAQPGARGAARRRATVRARVGDARTRRASRGSASRAIASIAGAEEIERLCGSDDHQGICAEVAEFRVRRRGRAAGRRATRRCSSRSTRSRTRRTSARSAAPPSAPGATGVVHPRAPRGRGDAGRVQGVGGGGRAPAGGAGAQPRRLPGRGQGGRAVVLRRRRRRDAWPTTRSTGPAAVVLVLGSEGRGLRPRVAARLRRARVDPAAGADRVAERQRGGGGAAVRGAAGAEPRRTRKPVLDSRCSAMSSSAGR